MRLLGPVGVIAVACACAAGAELAHGATAPAASAPVTTPTTATPADGSTTSARAYLKGFACHRSLAAGKRVVSVTAVMRHVPGTEGLKLRFQLLSSVPENGSDDVRGANLGSWISPDPSTLGQEPDDVWIVRHPVNGLAVPATYRFKVSFKWIGADHHAIHESTRLSASCYQPDMRPDLQIKSITVNPDLNRPADDRYVVQVANTGLTAARNLLVEFELTGATAAGPAPQTIVSLYPHTTRTVKFTAAACTSATEPTVTINGNGAVDTLDPADSTLTVACPTQTSSTSQTSGTARLH